jgi:hypothetical protein
MQYIQQLPPQVVKRVICRGTTSIFEPFNNQNWTGKEFKKHEVERLNLADNLLLIRSRGTDTFRAKELVETSIPDPKGHYIITGRGTGITKLS